MITIKLLSNNKGVIETRKMQRTVGDLPLHFSFFCPPELYTAVFKHDDKELYCPLDSNGNCAVRRSFIPQSGDISICVVRTDGSTKENWNCESVCVEQLNDKFESYAVYPSDMDLPARVVDLELSLEMMKIAYDEQKKQITQLQNEVTTLKEGYDIL